MPITVYKRRAEKIQNLPTIDQSEIKSMADRLINEPGNAYAPEIPKDGFHAYKAPSQTPQSGIHDFINKAHTLRAQEDMAAQRNKTIAIIIDSLLHILVINLLGIVAKKLIHPDLEIQTYLVLMVVPHMLLIQKLRNKYGEH